ncbi:MAG: TonB family protein [Gammaproteobacteria bacterium]
MTLDPRKPASDALPKEFVSSLESYIFGVISIEQIRRRIAKLLYKNQEWGPEMLRAIDGAFKEGHLNGTAHRTLVTEIDLGTSEDEPTDWSEETRAEISPVELKPAAVAATPDAAADESLSPKTRTYPQPDKHEKDNGEKKDTESPPVLTTAIGARKQVDAKKKRAPSTGVGPGTLLRHRYLIKQKIGTGSMGDVFKALDRGKEAAGSPEPWVALKVVSKEFSRNPNALDALKQEAAHGKRLEHPNIIRVHDFDWDGDFFFMTMEFLKGKSLVDLLNARRFKPLPRKQADAIIQGLCHGLGYAHARGIVHADIKPGNVFVTRGGHTKLLDFGIARVTAKMDIDFDATSIGAHTPAYSSCEVLEGSPPEPIDDVYSLGCVVYRLLSGSRAFGGATAVEAEAENKILERVPSLNDAEWQALQRALAWRRRQRTPDVTTFLTEFTGRATDVAAPSAVPAATPTDSDEKTVRGMPLKLAVPALAATAAAIALVLWWPDGDRDARVAGTPVEIDLTPNADRDVPELTMMSELEGDASDLPGLSPAPPADATDLVAAVSSAPDESPVAPAAEATSASTVDQTTAPAQRDPETERFEALLDAANQRMDGGQLIEPESDSAMYYVSELDTFASESPELQQSRLRLANLMLLEAMVAINDENFPLADSWISQTRALGVPDDMISRYATELNEAREAKATRESETIGAIFASATPAAILAEPEIAFEPSASSAAVDSAGETASLAMVLPGTSAPPDGEGAQLPAAADEAPQLPAFTPLSELEFRRFVQPSRPRGMAARSVDGWVDIRFAVDEKGRTGDIRITSAEPEGVFDSAARNAVKRWRFEPYSVDGEATPTESGVRLRFEAE